MLENSERSVRGVRMGKSGPLERAELANQIQGFVYFEATYFWLNYILTRGPSGSSRDLELG